MKAYIYQQPDWPHFKWDSNAIIQPLAAVRHLQGKLTGKMEALGFKLRNEAVLETLTTEVTKTSEIEGHILDLGQVDPQLPEGWELMSQASCHLTGMLME